MILKQRLLATLTAGMAVLSLSQCTVSTPQTRIAQNHSLYEALPAKHQELVQQGRIAKGMSKSAVYLAQGNPSRKVEGFRNNAPFERWDYTRLQPVYYNTYYASFGHGGFHHPYRHGRYYGNYGFAPAVDYIPYRASTVVFRRGVVDSWEHLSPPPY